MRRLDSIVAEDDDHSSLCLHFSQLPVFGGSSAHASIDLRAPATAAAFEINFKSLSRYSGGCAFGYRRECGAASKARSGFDRLGHAVFPRK
jgi:hypothetical protein